MEVIVNHVLRLSNTVTMKSAFRWSMGVVVVQGCEPGCTACPRWLPPPRHLKVALDFLSRAKLPSYNNERKKIGATASAQELRDLSSFFHGQRSSTAVNRTDYKICDPKILESSDDLETEHHHRV
jgi:hypothetical protein